jgi:hypothetical protein
MKEVSAPPKLPPDLREQVRQRAEYLCEYCHTSERWQYVRFTLDHVVPLGAGGNEVLENLALACFHCNRRKSNKLTATDPQSGAVVRLFNPRTQLWSEHFRWSTDGLLVLPQTPVGRATLELLELNRERILKIRRADVEVDRHPPQNDPIA